MRRPGCCCGIPRPQVATQTRVEKFARWTPGLLTLAGLFYVIGFVYAPGLVFFQSYALNFFGSRCAALEARMFPASEPPPPAVPSPPPEPAPA